MCPVCVITVYMMYPVCGITVCMMYPLCVYYSVHDVSCSCPFVAVDLRCFASILLFVMGNESARELCRADLVNCFFRLRPDHTTLLTYNLWGLTGWCVRNSKRSVLFPSIGHVCCDWVYIDTLNTVYRKTCLWSRPLGSEELHECLVLVRPLETMLPNCQYEKLHYCSSFCVMLVYNWALYGFLVCSCVWDRTWVYSTVPFSDIMFRYTAVLMLS